MGFTLHRTGVRLTLAAILAGLLACATAAGASAGGTSLVTYITGWPTSPSVWVATYPGGGAPSRLGPASSALISPSGAEVAAVNIEKQTSTATLSLYPTSPGGGDSAQITPKRTQFVNLLAWSPDSKLILVTVGTSPAQLMVVDTATNQSRAIASGVIVGAGFAPDSSDSVVFARAKLNTAAVNIYTTTPAGTDTHQLTSDGRSELPLWTPSGIVYSHETARVKNPYPELQLWEMNGDGTGARQLTNIQVSAKLEGLTPVACSDNGQHLLANLVGPPGSNSTAPYTVDLAAGQVHNLTGQSNGYIGDAISANGKTILVTKGTANDLKALTVETFPWAGGKPTALVKQGGYASWNR